MDMTPWTAVRPGCFFIALLGFGCIPLSPGGGYARLARSGKLSAYGCLGDGTERFFRFSMLRKLHQRLAGHHTVPA